MIPCETGALPKPIRPAAGRPMPPPEPPRAASRSGRRGGWRAAGLLPLLTLSLAPQALAAEGDPPAPPPAAREQFSVEATVRLLGRDVRGPSGDVVAQIANVLVDGAGQPVVAVLDYGGFMGVGRRRIAVVWRALRFAPGESQEGAITLGLTRDQLKDFPEAKRGEPTVAAAPAAAAAAPR